MPRAPTEHLPGALLHIISRFVNREIRVTQAAERQSYLERVPAALAASDLLPLCYALMGNHVHWGVRQGHLPRRCFFQRLHGGFARWLNQRQKRLGPLFADRPRQFALEEEGFPFLVAYIHNNPVRAGVVDDAADCDWTSHRAYIGEVPPPPWLDVHAGLSLCGFDASPRGRSEFHDFVRAAASQPRESAWSDESVARCRTQTRALLRAPVEVCGRIDERPHFSVLARPYVNPRPPLRISIPWVLKAVARELRLDEEELRSASRRRTAVEGRRLALIVWSLEAGRPQAEMAAALGISEAAASQLLGRPRAVRAIRERAGDIAKALQRNVTSRNSETNLLRT